MPSRFKPKAGSINQSRSRALPASKSMPRAPHHARSYFATRAQVRRFARNFADCELCEALE
jgi:hypothetical protein